MEALFHTGEEIKTEGPKDGGTVVDCSSTLPCGPSVYFALVGNNLSNTNSRMISVRANTEVFASK